MSAKLRFVVAAILTLVSACGPQPRTTKLLGEGAIELVVAAHPELAGYRHSGLPPKSIQTRPDAIKGGWYVTFLTYGSGLPGLLSAQCFRVSASGQVRLLSAYRRSGDDAYHRIDGATCSPAR